MTHDDLKTFLGTLGIPADTQEAMAQQLEKRAHQLSEKRNQSYETSLAHLIALLKQGWSAKQNNPSL